MPIPKIYAKPGISAIANYNYVDISTGTGVINFQGLTAIISGTTFYKLHTESIYSDTVDEISYNITTCTWDFNLTVFNKPQLVRGIAIISFSGGIAAGAGKYVYYVLTLRKVAADTSTIDLGSASTAPLVSAAGVVLDHNCVPITLTTTKFKVGESLRLNITSQANGADHYLAHDPANRNGTYVTPAATYPTKLEVYMPFKIDV